jgi:CHAD domain-containing protein
MKVNIDMENHTHELRVHIQKLKSELKTFCQVLGKIYQTTYMVNQLKEFKELLLDNALLKL